MQLIPIKSQIRLAISIVLLNIGLGTLGYKLLNPDWAVIDCLYQTIITITSIGFGEHPGTDTADRIFTIFVIVFGLVSMTYAAGIVVTWLVSLTPQAEERYWRRKMQKMQDHYIICGVSNLARYVISTLSSRNLPFVLVDPDKEHVKAFQDRGLFAYHGDYTDEDVLILAGIYKAQAIAACSHDDTQNVYTVLTSKEINPKIHVVAWANEDASGKRLRRAGADHVIMLTKAGGKEMVQALISPEVYSFTHQAFDISGFSISMEPLEITKESPFLNISIKDANLSSQFNLIPIVYKEPNGNFLFDPDPKTTLEESSVLLLVGPAFSHLALLNHLRKYSVGINYARDMELIAK